MCSKIAIISIFLYTTLNSLIFVAFHLNLNETQTTYKHLEIYCIRIYYIKENTTFSLKDRKLMTVQSHNIVKNNIVYDTFFKFTQMSPLLKVPLEFILEF